MFGSSFSPSWTYMVVLFKNNEEGHKVMKFTLPSNQTEYANDNVNAYRYFMHNLLVDLGYAVLGVISFEDYINTERVGIPLAFARKLELERERKEELNEAYINTVKSIRDSFCGVDYAKTKYKSNISFPKEFQDNLNKKEDRFDELFAKVFVSPEIQKKYTEMISSLTSEIVKTIARNELEKM